MSDGPRCSFNNKNKMPKLHKPKALLCLLLAALFLSGCAAPPALQILSFALDGVSYLATDKTVADHGLSALAQKDCKMFRGFKDEEICQDEKEDPILLLEEQNAPTE